MKECALAQAFINVSCTRSSARSLFPDSDSAKARKDGISASNWSFRPGRVILFISGPCVGPCPSASTRLHRSAGLEPIQQQPEAIGHRLPRGAIVEFPELAADDAPATRAPDRYRRSCRHCCFCSSVTSWGRHRGSDFERRASGLRLKTRRGVNLFPAARWRRRMTLAYIRTLTVIGDIVGAQAGVGDVGCQFDWSEQIPLPAALCARA